MITCDRLMSANIVNNSGSTDSVLDSFIKNIASDTRKAH